MKHILVIRPEKLGDLVVATPAFRAIRHSFPETKITVLVDQTYGDILAADPHVDHILRINWKWRYAGDHEPIFSIVRKIRSRGPFDAALVLYPNWSGWNVISFLAGISRVVQVGGTWAAVLLGHKVVRRNAYQRQLRYRDYYLEAARVLGATLPDCDDRNPRVYVSEEEKSAFRQRGDIPAKGRLVIVHPFGHGSSPNYSAESYLLLIRCLLEHPEIQICLTGGAADLAAWPGLDHPHVHTGWMGSLSVRELALACSIADVVVCGSTGVIHLAAAVGTPTVGLFCPHPGSHPSAWGPLGADSRHLVVPEMLCRKLHPSSSSCTANQQCDLICGIPVTSAANAVLESLNLA